jgi:hypothetical protein
VTIPVDVTIGDEVTVNVIVGYVDAPGAVGCSIGRSHPTITPTEIKPIARNPLKRFFIYSSPQFVANTKSAHGIHKGG